MHVHAVGRWSAVYHQVTCQCDQTQDHHVQHSPQLWECCVQPMQDHHNPTQQHSRCQVSSNTLTSLSQWVTPCTLVLRCEWMAKTEKAVKPIPHQIPHHIRKKMHQKPPPHYYEVDPAFGCLSPGETQDIRVRFMPSEEVCIIVDFSLEDNYSI